MKSKINFVFLTHYYFPMNLNKHVRKPEYFDKLIEHRTDAFFVVDEHGFVLYASPTVNKLFGFDPETLIGKSALEYIHPDDHHAARLRQSVLLVYPGNRVTADYRIRNVHNEFVWMECIFNNMINISQVNGVMVQMREISERKSFELQLEESEERFRIFMNNAPGAAWIRDEHGKYVFMNEAFQQMTNRKMADLIGKTYDAIFPDKAENIRDTDKLCLDYGKSVEYLDRLSSSDGIERDWVIHKFPLPQSNGKVFIGAFAFDYTKILRADQSIRESESRFRHIFDHSPDALFIEDENGVILEANAKAGDLQGVPVSSLIGANMLDLVPENRKAEIKDIHSKFYSGQISKYSACVWMKDGKEIPVDLRASFIQHKGKKALLFSLREK
ncbi:MAG TPA: PAS domain S-box protein [Bacteroidia bacterium]|nr:PAS domain S-box protein [Bacteroidia bacterium]